jgi:hypothetical protein
MSKPTVTLSQVLEFIYQSSITDRKAIGQALNSARNEDIATAKAEFKVGDKVMFKVTKRGYPRVIRGVILRKNIKTFHVRPNDGGREWKVTASLVEKDDQATTTVPR